MCQASPFLSQAGNNDGPWLRPNVKMGRSQMATDLSATFEG